MENQDLSLLFDKINHISLNYDDLLESFVEYILANKNLFDEFTVLNVEKLDILMKSPDFLEAAVLSARQAVVLSMLAITIEKNFDNAQFAQLCINCNCQSSKNYYLTQVIEELEQALSDPSHPTRLALPIMQGVDIKTMKNECLSLFRTFEKEIFSKILSKNKDMIQFTELNFKIIGTRKEIFFDLMDEKI